MNMNVLAVNTADWSTYDFLKDGETEEGLLQRANEYKAKNIATYKKIIFDLVKKPDCDMELKAYFETRLESAKNITYKVMSWNEYEEGKKKYLLSGDLKEVTKEEWEEALNVLPPYKWCECNGVEMFCMIEMYDGTYTTQYARHDGKYYCKMVDSADTSTWIDKLL